MFWTAVYSKYILGVDGIYARPMIAVMDEGWSAAKDYDIGRGQRIRIQCDFHGLDMHAVFLKTETFTYRLRDGGNFNQWVYLVLPSQFSKTVIQKSTAFVNYMNLSESVDGCSLTMNVNYVYAGASAGGFMIGRRDYTLAFEK